MDAFVTRHGKRKRPPTPPPPASACLPQTANSPDTDTADTVDTVDTQDDDSTEIKLALLASLVGDIGTGALLELLLAHDGAVAAAAESFRTRRFHRGAIGKQTSLRSLLPGTESADKSGLSAGPAPKLLARRGQTLHLYDPADVAAHAPCTLVHNFLPPDTADALLREMLAESTTFGPPHTFKLFDTVVSSPHRSCLYLESAAEATAAAARAQTPETTGFVLDVQAHDGYRYNGSRLRDVRPATTVMQRVRPLVQAAVNAAVQARIVSHQHGRRLTHQNAHPWRPNAAFVNCYRGGAESVGWHSDQMTYLGPRAVIGSLSLGVARSFRVRKILPRDDGRDTDDAGGQISIHLPHNSLLVMHAEMQEQWKHAVVPAAAIDPHPVAGNVRINITFRDYRPEFHPDVTPRCRCGIPAVMRVVQRKLENYGRYFWMCHAGNIPGHDGCPYFQWAEFDDNGRPASKPRHKAGNQ